MRDDGIHGCNENDGFFAPSNPTPSRKVEKILPGPDLTLSAHGRCCCTPAHHPPRCVSCNLRLFAFHQMQEIGQVVVISLSLQRRIDINLHVNDQRQGHPAKSLPFSFPISIPVVLAVFAGSYPISSLSSSKLTNKMDDLDILSRLIYGSNMIESVGNSLNISNDLCKAVFAGQEVTAHIDEDDGEYYREHVDHLRANHHPARHTDAVQSR